MLKNAVLFAISSVAIVFLAPELAATLKPADAPPARPAPVVGEAEPQPTAAVAAPSPAAGDEEFAIPADPHGQFVADVLLNGQSVRMLIDTGAYSVAVSQDVAERIGLHPALGAPQVSTQTANGVAVMTQGTLSTVAIGPIFMTDVPALIVDRSAGAVNVIGTNFLKRLAGVEQRDGWLYLRQ